MKKKKTTRTAAFFSMILFMYAALAGASSDTLSVKVREVKLRTEPKIWAPVTVSLVYGDTLKALSAENGWFKVKTAAGKEGYLHYSAVSDKPIVLGKPVAGASAKPDEGDVVLAGKGFNKQVEKEYAGRNKTLSYAAVDEMERVRVGEKELADFVKQGKLAQGGQPS